MAATSDWVHLRSACNAARCEYAYKYASDLVRPGLVFSHRDWPLMFDLVSHRGTDPQKRIPAVGNRLRCRGSLVFIPAFLDPGWCGDERCLYWACCQPLVRAELGAAALYCRFSCCCIDRFA